MPEQTSHQGPAARDVLPALSTTGPLGLEDHTDHQPRRTSGGTSSGRCLEPAPTDWSTCLAAGAQAGHLAPEMFALGGQRPACSGPRVLALSSRRFIYLSFVWAKWERIKSSGLFELQLVERKACLFLLKESLTLWPWPLSWVSADNALLSPCARQLAPACPPACLPLVQWACCCPLDLAAGKEGKETPGALADQPSPA